MTTGELSSGNGPAVVPKARQGRSLPRPEFTTRLARLVAIGLVALWVLWAAVAWTSAPRRVSVEQFRQDVAAARVHGFQVASGRDRDSSWLPFGRGDFWWTATPSGPSTAADAEPDNADLVVYRTDYRVGSVRYLDHDETRGNVWPFIEELRSAQVSGDRSVRSGLEQDLQRARPFAAALALLSLVLVLFGPTPKRGTRWAWFFLLGTNLGLGVVGYAVLELWRAGAPIRMVVLRSVARVRWRGWEGYLLMLVVSTVVSLTTWGLSALLGTWWVPTV
jgi:hypothetical protein